MVNRSHRGETMVLEQLDRLRNISAKYVLTCSYQLLRCSQHKINGQDEQTDRQNGDDNTPPALKLETII